MSIWIGFIYFGLCIAAGLLANKRGRSGAAWFAIALIASPLLAFAFLLATQDKAHPTSAEPKPITAAFTWPETGGFDTEVFGESHYQPALRNIVASLGGHGDTSAKLKTDAMVIPYSNPQDPNAVKIEIQGQIVGHLSKYEAKLYRERLKLTASGVAPSTCRALIMGGFVMEDGERAHYGLKLQLPYQLPS